MFGVYKSLRFFATLDHYLSLLPITDANIKIFKYNKSPSKQYQFTPVYQKLSYLHFFFFFFCWPVIAGDKENCIFCQLWPFFDLVCPVLSAKTSQEEKKPMPKYHITCV